MDIDQLVDNDVSENRDIEYKHPGEEIDDIVKELAAMANSGGGRVIIGVAEENHEIQSLAPVENPGRLEENIQQAIASKISPTLPVIPELSTYQGRWDEYSGIDLMTITVDDDDRLYSFQVEDYGVLPTRLGSITRYMSGQQIVDFYENGYYPGRGPTSEDGAGSSSGSAFAEIIEHVAQTATESDDSPVSSEDEENKVDEVPEFSSSKPRYFFTPSNEYAAVTFYNTLGQFQPHGIEGVARSATVTEIKRYFGALQTHLDAQLETGAFAITQRNGAWFGYGAGNFLKALDWDARYDSVPMDYDLDVHHSEGIIFFTRVSDGYVVIRARNGRGQKYIDEFNVSFLTEGVPIDNRNIIAFLEDTGLSLQNGYDIEVRNNTYHPTGDEMQLNTVEHIESKHHDNWVGKIICENPFHNDPSLLKSTMDDDDWSYYEAFTTYRYLLCKLSDHHPMEEAREYHLRRVNLQELTEVQGTIPHLNASVSATW